ncbi:hypothetical protein AZI86_00210 [Bdellovibrio bacteriovorus]|uniref:Uncharacterized protein n=1 Tax=Bdellovibrio bacteriovorus TaxID=959 RepID=A0A150WMC2_BDEBC|nr:hypothetical protein [Bdellovibrio bacteriovorus]KYG65538.1 hypothetical protein AZI86_00210 [Bdellovibrio bacteriovorus]
MRILLFFVILFGGAPLVHAKTSLGLNDVSVLLPLPKVENDMDLLLRPQEGFIPKEVLAQLDPLIIDDQTQDRIRSLKLIAFRIDPCFVESIGPAACRRQLRMVFQPVSFYQNSALVFDAAVHAFFEFDDASWNVLLKDWASTLTDSAGDKPLQVHPVIKAQGLKGDLWKTYRQVLQKNCKPNKLVRITQSTVDRFGMSWDFSGFDIDATGKFMKLNIPRINVTKQTFFSNPGDLKEFSAEITPVPEGENTLADFFHASNRQAPQDQWDVVKKSFEFENPTRFNTANLDCVSCHMAQSLRLWGEVHFNDVAGSKDIKRLKFSSPRSLDMSVKPFAITNRVRAFGYFFDEANISPRVINESALAADSLEKLLP